MQSRLRKGFQLLDFSQQQPPSSHVESVSESSKEPPTESPITSRPKRSALVSKRPLPRVPSLLAGSNPSDLSQLPPIRECTAPVAADARSVRSAAKSAAASEVDLDALLDALLAARDRIDDALDLVGAESEGSPEGSDAESPVAPASPAAAMDAAAMDDVDA